MRQDGVTLTNYYVFRFCSPTRSTFMTGRFPYHRYGESWFSPSHRMQSACFISLPALLDCGALERARSSLKLALKVSFDNPAGPEAGGKSFDKRLGSPVWVAPVSSPRRTMLCPLGRDLGMPKGSAWGHLGHSAIGRTAQAARPPLVGLLWSGSSWETIYR
jgi:hypothetical protein